MMGLTITTALFEPVAASIVPQRSRVYSPAWVDILYRMCRRNITQDFDLVCLTHYNQLAFDEPVVAVPFVEDTRQMMCLTEVFRPDLKIDRGLFIALDTVIMRNIDHLIAYDGPLAMPRFKQPGSQLYYNPVCFYQGEAAVPLWHNRDTAQHGNNSMTEFGVSEMLYWCNSYDGPIDDVHELWPLQVASYQWLTAGLNDRGDISPAAPDEVAEHARIVYFFGEEKPHNTTLSQVQDHWR